MLNILNIIRDTPYVVWAILIYLLFRGIKACKNRNIHLFKMIGMPLIFITWSILSIYSSCGFAYINAGLWLIFCIIGIKFGYKMIINLKISIDKDKKLIHLPGSFTPLILSLTFFAMKYFLTVTYELNPLMKKNLILTIMDLAISGIISGISLGRFIYVFYKYKNTKR